MGEELLSNEESQCEEHQPAVSEAPESQDHSVDVKEQRYLDQRKAYIDRESQLADLFDKSLITISTAALGASLAFIQHVAADAPPPAKALFTWAWAVLSGALLLSLGSIFFAQHSHHIHVLNLDDERLQEIGEARIRTRSSSKKGWVRNTWCELAFWANVFSAISIVLGIALLFLSLREMPWKGAPEAKIGAEMANKGSGSKGSGDTKSAGGHRPAVSKPTGSSGGSSSSSGGGGGGKKK